MLYHYLDGLDKKGPYTAEEIIHRKLSPDTLIFAEGADKWLPLSSFHELSEPPTIQEKVPESENPEESNETRPVAKRKVKIPSFVLFILFLIPLMAIGYFFALYQRNKDLDKLNATIDQLFKGKTSVSDYRKNGTDGVLYDVRLDYFLPGNVEKNVMRTDNFTIAFKPDADFEGGESSESYKRKLKQWNESRQFVEYYESSSPGAVTTIHLKRDGNEFTVEETWSGDMAYKVAERTYHPGKDFGYGLTTDGYYTSNYRPAVHTCYEQAAKYLTEENEDKSYDPGSYQKIENFTSLKSDFYNISTVYGKKYYRLGNDVYLQINDGSPQKIQRKRGITKATSMDDAYVYTGQWTVWYRSHTNRYYIWETGQLTVYLLAYFTIGAVLSLALTLFIIYRKKVSLQLS